MKKEFNYLLLLVFVITISSLVFAQPTHTIDFEPAGVGASWNWIVGENADNPPLEFIPNPVSGGNNTSPTVAKFITRQAGNPWALFFTDDDGEFTFDATNSTVKIMVYKTVISPVHFKVEGATGTPTELIGTNTVVNQWEEITFDFSGQIGQTYSRLVIIPDFYARPQDNIIYLDNIQVPDGVVFNQPTHNIDFEPSGVGADWEWIVAENADNPPLEFISNPDPTGLNTSPTVAKFIARQAGNPWALFFTDDDGEFTFDATNSTVKIMVWKPVISPVHFKVEGATGTPLELIDTNTVVNQWEELTYDFSSLIGKTYNRIVIIPDFYARPQENIIYIDNIKVPDGVVNILPEPTVHAPTPTLPASSVISVFSDVYPNIPANLNPYWGQSTTVSFMTIQGDTTMVYGNLNYQGIELGSSQNLIAAGMQYLHLDFWTPNATDLGVFLISPGPVETRVDLIPPGALQTWVSRDIPLADFSPVDLTNVFQFKFVGNGTIYLDNIYFTSTLSDVTEIQNAVPSDFTLEQNYPNPFNPTTNIRFNLPEANQVLLKVYDFLGQEAATLVDKFMNAGSYEVSFDAKNLPTGIYFYSISAGNFSSVKKMLLIK